MAADGAAHCWGRNSAGQLGDGSTTDSDVPVPIESEQTFASLDAGGDHTCGISSSGRAFCWGANDRGQLGDGTTRMRMHPVAVAGELRFEQITAGGFELSPELVAAGQVGLGHTCGLTEAGMAYCWGDNERGQLGLGSSDTTDHPEPVAVSGELTFILLTAGLGRHMCGITDDGAARCWGENTFGGLGDDSFTDRSEPAPVSGELQFTHLVAGGFIGHTCGLTADGTAYCWGENERGQVGDGSTIDQQTPAAVTGGLVFTGLDAGFRHTCGIDRAGIAYCWGSGGAGQFGTNSTSNSSAPVKVIGQP